MKLLVKFHRDVDRKPRHIPDDWPAEVVELPTGYAPPPRCLGPEWVTMTKKEYADYRTEHWVETKIPERPAPTTSDLMVNYFLYAAGIAGFVYFLARCAKTAFGG